MSTTIGLRSESAFDQAQPGSSREPKAGTARRPVQANERRERGRPKQALNLGWIRALPLLSAEQERELATRIRTGDQAARESLILANIRLVVNIARRYKTFGVAFDDLIQEGNRGLIRAAQDFDPFTYNARFSTYATHWIRHSIRRAITANCSLIRFPEYIYTLRNNFERAVNEVRGSDSFDDAGKLTPGPDRVAALMGISERQMENLRRTTIERSGFYQLDEEGMIVSFENAVADRHLPDEDLEEAEQMEQLEAALKRLSPMESWVIRRRFRFAEPIQNRGCDTSTRPPRPLRDQDGERQPAEQGKKTHRRHTYHQISLDCGMTIHHIRRVERLALEKLRQSLGAEPARAG